MVEMHFSSDGYTIVVLHHKHMKVASQWCHS